ncbi:ABC transporter substrate-binding protein [Paenibacillus sp. NPDC058071]|uniref:ABC transporter substrate-binding protein n=1 Tax=Paenibacillus sp. NPDC058071 TaxID=3346326 RepID=UPI0036DB56A9
MNRRKKKHALLTAFLVLLLLAGCSSNSGATEPSPQSSPSESSKPAEQPKTGGAINIGYPTQPVTLDAQISGTTATKDISRSLYEQLVTLDANAQVIPQLAESYEVSDDKLSYTFHLRKGVKFHNGKELKAEDAVASLNRWIKVSSLGKANFTGAEASQTDDYTVVLKLETPFLLTVQLLADPIPAAAIYPKEVVEAADEKGIKDYIGTGPYKLAEWKQDQFIKLSRFDDYSSRTEPTNGAGGKKTAFADDIIFHFVSDESTRIAGITSGQYDIALNISVDNENQISSNPDLKTYLSPGGFYSFFYNSKQGLFQNVKLRQAVNAVQNADDILRSAFRDENFYVKTSSLVVKEFPNWYSEAGKENYSQANPEKAKQLLQEAGYKGEEIVIYTTRDYIDQYNVAVVLQQELESIGVKVKLDVFDWPTLQEKLNAGVGWDLYPISYAFRPNFYQYGFWGGGQGLLKSDKLNELLQGIRVAESIEAARPVIDEVHNFIYSEVPFSPIGHNRQITALSNKVEGFENILGPIFWNVSIQK